MKNYPIGTDKSNRDRTLQLRVEYFGGGEPAYCAVIRRPIAAVDGGSAAHLKGRERRAGHLQATCSREGGRNRPSIHGEVKIDHPRGLRTAAGSCPARHQICGWRCSCLRAQFDVQHRGLQALRTACCSDHCRRIHRQTARQKAWQPRLRLS
jgi:hypothetical protein